MLEVDRELNRLSQTPGSLNAAGIPDFDAMMVLNVAIRHSGLQKPALVAMIMEVMGISKEKERVFYRHLDSLIGLGYMSKNDFRFYVTETGTRFYNTLISQNLIALKRLAFGIP